MNGQLPASTSSRYSLNWADAQKLFRMVLVQVLALTLTLGVPYLTGRHYVVQGQDLTPEVLLIVNATAEMIRRFLAGGPAPDPPADSTAPARVDSADSVSTLAT